MGFTSFKGLWSEMSGRGAGSSMVVWGLMSVLSLGGITGCGVEPSEQETWGLETQSRAQEEQNGLSLNGLSLNGLSLNGLSINGLSFENLASADFEQWFNLNPKGHEALVRYMMLCAGRAGDVRTYVNPLTGKSYTWVGSLGLAPDWVAGTRATVDEQQLITACLAAHANNYELHVPISVLGQDAQGKPLPFTSEELTTYAQNEACFFGNIFTTLNPGLFAGNDRGSLDLTQSTPRACGLLGYGEKNRHPDCLQVERIGQCGDQHCTLDPQGLYYTECSYKGVKYKPLTTRIRPGDVAFCGNGTCDVGERKGPGYTATSCKQDCGE